MLEASRTVHVYAQVHSSMYIYIPVTILAQDLQGPRPDRPMMLWPWDAWTPLTPGQAVQAILLLFCCVMKFLYHVKYRPKPNMKAHAPDDIVRMKTCQASHQDEPAENLESSFIREQLH